LESHALNGHRRTLGEPEDADRSEANLLIQPAKYLRGHIIDLVQPQSRIQGKPAVSTLCAKWSTDSGDNELRREPMPQLKADLLGHAMAMQQEQQRPAGSFGLGC